MKHIQNTPNHQSTHQEPTKQDFFNLQMQNNSLSSSQERAQQQAQKVRKKKSKREVSNQMEQQKTDEAIEPQTETQPTIRKSSRLKLKEPIQTIQFQEAESEQQQIARPEQFKEHILNPPIQFIIWKQQHQSELRYLAKFYGRSYLHCKWLPKAQLSSLGFEFTHGMIKSMHSRMRKTLDLKLKEQTYFNPNFTKVDRVLSSTELITSINHKVINEIKGQWSESLALVCSKMLNFMKDNYPYGVHFCNNYDEQLQKKYSIEKPMHIGKVFNRIMVKKYKKCSEVWKDIGLCVNNYLLIYPHPQADPHKIGQTMKQAVIFLYIQWHQLSKERFLLLKNDLVRQGIIEQDNSAESYESSRSINYKIKSEEVNVIELFCKNNIFISQNTADIPTSEEELKQLNPGTKTFDWIQLQFVEQDFYHYQFALLSIEDMKQLDLNTPVDRVYLIKWKDLSYQEITWQKQSSIQSPSKIEQFNNYNKYPSPEIEKILQKNRKMHLSLLQYSDKNSQKSHPQPKSEKLLKYENQLYLLQTKQPPREYGNKDIPIFKNYRKLKEFQLQSLNWLIKNWHQSRNSILADQMGLGKTIQTISFLYHLLTHEQVIGPFLILAPLSTLHQWRREVEQWTNFNCLLYYDQGNFEMRQIIRQSQFYFNKGTKDGEIVGTSNCKFQILLTNYQLFSKDFQYLKQIPFQHVVLDEAHKLKNKQSKITILLNRLPCCRKTLLTGTPLQNNTKQLWTLLNFIEPLNFHSEEQFLAKYGKLQNEQQVKDLCVQIKPYLLRRIKEDVQSAIPKLSQLIISVQMTTEQKKYYRGLLEKNKKEMIKGLSSANFNSISTQLRKCCNHPYLIAHQVEHELKRNCKSQDQQYQVFKSSSGKIILLLKLLQKFKRQGKKVLIFSQFVMMLDLIKPFLQKNGYNCQILKGSQTSTIRSQAISRFNEDSNKTDIFLISTKAGGVGINLISASEVIIYDSDWNPQNDIQATARAHRIGQKKEVTVYRLITANSYQAEMFKISSRKLGLDKAVFTGEYFKSGNANIEMQKIMSKEQIETLLKKGVLGFLQSQNQNDQFFNQSIEDILEKNSKRIEYNTAQSSFSKTTFKADQKQNLQIDAPDFWEVALRNVQTPIDKLCKKGLVLKEYESAQSQQQLMFQAYHIIFNFVKHKTVSTGFNTEDQIHLIKFLKGIGSERHFHKHYKQISFALIQEIQKPSRRFKVKYEDIYLIKPQNLLPQQQGNFEDDTQQIDSPNNKNEKQLQSSKDNYDSQPVNDPKSMQNYQRLCYICWRPKCLYFCNGPCGRCFHSKCWQNLINGDYQRTCITQIDERFLNYQTWLTQVNFTQSCENCLSQNYFFDCSICFQKGTFDHNINKNKEKYKKLANEFNKEMIFKCNMKNCHRFYHLRCLFSQQFEGRFADKAGKVMKSVKQQSIIFRCPAHYCFACYGKESQNSKSKPITCAICCITLHLKCMDTTSFPKMRKNTYICQRHLNPKLELTLYEEYKMFTESNNNKHQHKRQNKQIAIQQRIQKLREHRQIGTPQPIKYVKQKKEKKEPKHVYKYSYQDFILVPIGQFDFMNFKGDWCRYCGSRFSQSFKKGPWGKRKLCAHHYTSWKKGKLDLSQYGAQPLTPIDIGRNTQIKYLNIMQGELNLKPFETVIRLRQMMIEQREKQQQKKQKMQNEIKNQQQIKAQ